MTSREEALEDIGVEVLKFAEWYRTLHDGPDMIKGGLLLNTSEAIFARMGEYLLDIYDAAPMNGKLSALEAGMESLIGKEANIYDQ